MLECARILSLLVTNTVFRHKRTHTITRYPANEPAKPSLKDYIMVGRSMRSMVRDTRVRRAPGVESDHKFVKKQVGFSDAEKA